MRALLATSILLFAQTARASSPPSGPGPLYLEWEERVSREADPEPKEFSLVNYFFTRGTVTNQLADPSGLRDFYGIVAPIDPRLPEGGGYLIRGLTNNAAVGALPGGRGDVTLIRDELEYTWAGVDTNFVLRARGGLRLSGGTSTGRGVQEFCEVVARLPELFLTGNRTQTSSCDVAEPWLTQFRGLVSYIVPKIDVQVSATLQAKPGTLGIAGNTSGTNGGSIAANYAAPNLEILQSLGRLPTGGQINGNTSVNLLLPGDLYGDRINQLDLRLAKILRFGRTRTQVGVDLYNLLNSNPGLTYNETFSGTGQTWLRPTSILLPRFARFNVTVDF